MSSEANGVPQPAEAASRVPPAALATSAPSADPPLSKNQLKKLKKKQEWEDGREQRKIHRKAKDKARKERKREEIIQQITAEEEAAANGSSIPANLDADGNSQNSTRAPKLADRQHAGIPGSQQVPVTFLFDCDFDDLMLENELTSLGSQLTRCYSDNRKGKFRAHLAVSSYGGRLKERFEGVLEGQHKNWKGFRVCEEDFESVAEQARVWMREKGGGRVVGAIAQGREQKAEDDGGKGSEDVVARKEDIKKADQGVKVMSNGNRTEEAQKDDEAHEVPSTDGAPTKIVTEASSTAPEEYPDGEVIYLTADSPNTLTTLSPYSTYIIGGIIDRNRHKGICYKRAVERGVKTAKLPIGEYLEMASRQVLATNHVNEIMVKWLEEGDWGRAFMSVIPKRKGGVLKGEGKPEQKRKRVKKGQNDKSGHPLAEDNYDSDPDGGVLLDSGNDNDGQKDISVKAEELEHDLKAAEKDSTMVDASADTTVASTLDEPVTADDQLDIAARAGQVNQAANLKRSAPEADTDPEELRKKVKAFLD